MRPPLTALLLLASGALAGRVACQQTIVSPLASATVEGGSSNAFPWADARPRRYLQIHSDIVGPPRLITRLAWRKDGAAITGTGSRSIQLELFMGEAVDWDQASFVIGNNYLGPRVNVLARKLVNFGPVTGMGSPSPFELAIVLDSIHVYFGIRSLAWEAVIHGNTLAGTFPGACDTDLSTNTPSAVEYGGAGCIATGQVAPMNQRLALGDSGGTFSLGGYLEYGPVSAPAILALGTKNPGLPVPGLCAPLYTDLAVMVSIGTTDATGFIGATSAGTSFPGGAFSLVAPNTFAGAVIHTQVHAIDLGSARPIKIASSGSAVFTVPASNPLKVNRITRIFNNDGGTAASAGIYLSASTIGYGLPTEFRF